MVCPIEEKIGKKKVDQAEGFLLKCYQCCQWSYYVDSRNHFCMGI